MKTIALTGRLKARTALSRTRSDRVETLKANGCSRSPKRRQCRTPRAPHGCRCADRGNAVVQTILKRRLAATGVREAPPRRHGDGADPMLSCEAVTSRTATHVTRLVQAHRAAPGRVGAAHLRRSTFAVGREAFRNARVRGRPAASVRAIGCGRREAGRAGRAGCCDRRGSRLRHVRRGTSRRCSRCGAMPPPARAVRRPAAPCR